MNSIPDSSSQSLSRILVGTSLVPISDEVVAAALAIARTSGARLELVHSTQRDPLCYQTDLIWLYPESLEHQLDTFRKELERQQERLGIRPEEVGSAVVKEGPPHRVLTDHAEDEKVDLIVVGASETDGVLGRMLGSTADRLSRRAPCPILMVRSRSGLPPQRVLVPVDLSPACGVAIRQGLDLLAEMADGPLPHAEFLFVLSEEQRGLAPQFTPEQVEEMSRDSLERFVARYGSRTGGPVSWQVQIGEVRPRILETVDEHEPDLVLMPTHGYSGFDRFVLGSVAADVVRRSAASVLLVPARGEEAAET